MTLGDKRRLFTKLLAEFICWCFDQGFEVSLGQVVRIQAEANANAAAGTGISKSLHLIGLAADLNLYLDSRPGVDDDIYQKDSEKYYMLGVKWESMHPLCRWGGRFKKPDGNHFSLEHEGVK